MNIWLVLLVGVISYFLGFGSYHATLIEDAKNGGLIMIDGKVYKLVEQRVK